MCAFETDRFDGDDVHRVPSTARACSRRAVARLATSLARALAAAAKTFPTSARTRIPRAIPRLTTANLARNRAAVSAPPVASRLAFDSPSGAPSAVRVSLAFPALSARRLRFFVTTVANPLPIARRTAPPSLARLRASSFVFVSPSFPRRRPASSSSAASAPARAALARTARASVSISVACVAIALRDAPNARAASSATRFRPRANVSAPIRCASSHAARTARQYAARHAPRVASSSRARRSTSASRARAPVSYTHLRAHET